MRVDVRFRGLTASGALRQHTLDRLRRRLRHHSAELSHVTVRFGDVNGPRGGIDKRCTVCLHGPGGYVARVDKRRDCFYAALDAASDSSAKALRRRGGRTRRHRPGTMRPHHAI